MTDLKPCPLCGSPARVIAAELYELDEVECTNEECGILIQDIALAVAIEHWNNLPRLTLGD